MREFGKRFPAIASRLDSDSMRMFISANTGAVYEISETSMFPLPDSPLSDRRGSSETAKAFLDFWFKRTDDDSFLYFAGMWDNRMRKTIARFPKIRMVKCLSGKIDDEFIRIFSDLVCVSRIRTNEMPVLPFPYKYLRECLETQRTI